MIPEPANCEKKDVGFRNSTSVIRPA